MKRTVDALGKTCPLPVVETKKALVTLAAGDTVEVLVDNDIAVQNLTKMATQKKLPIQSEKINDNHYVVTLTAIEGGTVRVPEAKATVQAVVEAVEEQVVVVLASDKMGEGDENLGHQLMKAFIYALTEQDTLPQTILLYNRGAYLTTESQEAIADLKLLEDQGVEVLTCGACLNHYGLVDKLGVGSVTNMYVIIEKQMQATKIIQP